MSRDFDIAVFGASGFTGKLVAEHLAKLDKSDRPRRWALAGRDLEKLAAVQKQTGADVALTSMVRLLIIDEVHLLHEDRGPVIEVLVARTLRQVESSQVMLCTVYLDGCASSHVMLCALS